MTLLHLTLLLLATARLTRLVTTDVLTKPLRGRATRALLVYKDIKLEHPLSRTSGFRYQLAYLIVCDWCASMYVGGAVAGAWWAWGDTMWLMMVYAALSASYATGFLASKTEG